MAAHKPIPLPPPWTPITRLGCQTGKHNVFFQGQLASWRALLAVVWSPLKSSAALTCGFKMRDELFGLLGRCTRYFPFDSPFKLREIYIHLNHGKEATEYNFQKKKKKPIYGISTQSSLHAGSDMTTPSLTSSPVQKVPSLWV